MKKTKIIATLGPASGNPEILREMLSEGMNVARLNFSHGDYENHKKMIDLFKQVREEMGIAAGLLLDTKGPEVRLGNFKLEPIMLEEGQKFTLFTEERPGDEQGVGVSYGDLFKYVEKGTEILLDDGSISLIVEEIRGNEICCIVGNSGEIKSHKGVNVPNASLNMEFLSEKDKVDIRFGIENNVDYIAASFVRTGEDVAQLRRFLKKNGGSEIKIIAKIENMEGIHNFDHILKRADGIMIARGDMGVEIDFSKLPGYQKQFIRKCNAKGKIVITATQMLESMTEEATPTRAEITDVANAVFDGTSAVMLSGESAVGRYPVIVVETMAQILKRAEEDGEKNNLYQQVDYSFDKMQLTGAIGHGACTLARDLKVKAILAITKSGQTALRVAKYRPNQPIIAITPSKKVYEQLSLVRGVYPQLMEFRDNWDESFLEARQKAKESGLVKKGDKVVVTAGLPLHVKGKTNMIIVETI